MRKIHADVPTLLLDESDAAFNSDKEYAEALRGVLNNGYTRGKPYTTCVGQGAGIKPHDFKVFCPKAIAGIGKLPDTVADRSVPIALKRRAPGERIDRFRRRRAEAEGAEIANALHQVRETDGFAVLDGAEPKLPDELDDPPRMCGSRCWRSRTWRRQLAGVGAGGREALFPSADPAEDSSLGIRLLADCRPAFDGREVIWTSDLLDHLHALDEAPWGEWEVRPKRIADLLRPYGIRSRNVRTEKGVRKGYRREDFQDPWTRYLADSPPANATSATAALTSQERGVAETLQRGGVADGERADNPHSNADVADVAFRGADRAG